MRFIKFTTEKIVRRLRWFVVCAICFDATLTLLGQPTTYWHDHQTALEGNPFFRHYLCLGYLQFCLVMLGFAALAFLFISVFSIFHRGTALILIFYCLFMEFFTTETWLMFHWKLGLDWLTAYAAVFAATVALLTFPKQVWQWQLSPGPAPKPISTTP